MFGLLGLVAMACTGYQLIKEACEPTIPAENWANKELYHKDVMAGVPIEQRMKWVEQGKYKLPKQPEEVYPEPHRNEYGQIVIENNLLYQEDLKKYGAYQTYKWMEQGKYNLTPEELEKERKRIKDEYKKLYKLIK